jgi:hypothetical protein
MFSFKMLEVILLWSFLCSIDGCIVVSASFGATRGYSPLKWAGAISLGHILLGSLGLVITGIVALWVSSISMLLSIVAITFVLGLMIKELVKGHHHHEPKLSSMWLLAFALSGDAVLQGIAIHGQLAHDHHQSAQGLEHAFEAFGVIGAGLLATLAIGLLVGLYAYLASIGVRALSDRFEGIKRRLPALGFGLLTYIWLSMIQDFSVSMEWISEPSST